MQTPSPRTPVARLRLTTRLAPTAHLALIVLLTLTACATPVPFQDTFAGGAVKSQGEMLRDAQVGDWTYYWQNGQRRAQGHYERDLQVGPWTWWYENGQMRVSGSFHAEQSEGPWRYWHPNGKPQMSGFFAGGRKTGAWSVFDGAGRLVERGQYARGKRTGHWEFRYATGGEKAEGWFRDGEMIGAWTFWNAEGESSAKDYPMPPNVALFGETWNNGKLRRAGLLEHGGPQGRWLTWHDNGAPRMSGDFARGQPCGRWRAFAPDGELLALGRVDAAHPRGIWSFVRDTQAADLNAAPAPPAVWSGVWSKATEFAPTADRDAVDRWLLEATSPRETNTWESGWRATGDARARRAATPARDVVDAIAAVPRTPVAPPILTHREIAKMGEWLKSYTKEIVTDAFDIYASSKRGPLRRDARRSKALVGKSLMKFEFAAPDGTRLALRRARDRWTLLVVLRGFAGQVCPYCPAQLKALAPFRAEFDKLGVRVVAVYPGPREGLDGFSKAYADTFGDGMKPPYTIFYDVESRLARALSILETDPASAILARPTTLLLDEKAEIVYAYVGRHRGDRPAAESLLETIRKCRHR